MPVPSQRSLTYLLQKAAKYSLERLEGELADLDLTARQYLALAMVAGGERFSQQELAQKLGLDPTLVVKLLDQLEARELLTRERAADDRRRHQLALTPAGRTVLRQAEARHERAERAVFESRGEPIRALLDAALPGGEPARE